MTLTDTTIEAKKLTQGAQDHLVVVQIALDEGDSIRAAWLLRTAVVLCTQAREQLTE